MTFVWGIQAFLAVLLLRAAAHKLLHRQEFRSELRAYRLLPEASLSTAPFLLALAEIACIFSLIAAACLLSLYTFAMLVNLQRGNITIDCGCSGWLSPRKQLDYWLVIRNSCLIILALVASQLDMTNKPMALSETLIGISLLATLLFLYESAEQAISNSQRQRHWLKTRSEVAA